MISIKNFATYLGNRYEPSPFFIDGFVKSPISALRFIPRSLRRTARTPHSADFARLELGLITKPSGMITTYGFILVGPEIRILLTCLLPIAIKNSFSKFQSLSILALEPWYPGLYTQEEDLCEGTKHSSSSIRISPKSSACRCSRE